MDISQSDFISLIAEKATILNMNVENMHYTTHSDYYWKNKGQFISVLNKGIPDDKLKIIFQTHIQKVSKVNECYSNKDEVKNENSCNTEVIIPQTKIVKTEKYSVFVKI